MPVTYGNANYRKKFDAFRIIDESGHEPLKNAIACALRLRQSAEVLEKAMEDATFEDRAKLALALTRCIPDEFHAWIKVAEFVYSKPKQPIEVTGTLSLEQLLAGSWETTAERPTEHQGGHA